MPLPTGAYPNPVLTFHVATSLAVTTSVFSFAGVAIGSAASDRVVIVSCAGQSATAAVISSLTVAGITALIPSQASVGAAVFLAVAGASVPSNTTATLVLTFSTSIADATIGVYSLNNTQSLMDFASSSFTSGTQVLTLVKFVQQRGSVIGLVGAIMNSATLTTVWSGLTNDFTLSPTANVLVSGAHLNNANRTQAMTSTLSTSPIIGDSLLFAVAFG